jgi:hypothetical protein
VSKCKWTLFGTPNRLRNTDIPNIKIGSEAVEQVFSYKYLGLHLDAHLHWKTHIELLEKKIRQRLGVLKRIRSYIDQNTAQLLFNTLIMPIIDYCDTVYTNCPSLYLNRIQRLMMRGGRIILNVRYDTPSQTVLQMLNWMTLHERLYFHTCVLMYKCVNFLCPEYLCSKFEKVDHRYNTRHSCNLKVPKCKTSKGQSSFSCKGAKAWNNLPYVIRNAPSQDSFKQNLLTYIFKNRSV